MNQWIGESGRQMKEFTTLFVIFLLSATARGDSWPMFRGGPALLGVANGKLPDKPTQLWSFKTGRSVKSSPAIEGGKVFVGSDDGILYALDFVTGKKLWEFKTGDSVESSPLV